MKKYAIVTDSTTYLSEEEFAKYGIKRGSLNVIDGDQSYKELEVEVKFVEDLLNNGKRLTTSQPAPGEFLEIYEGLLDEGYEKIFVLVISGPLSGTFQSANIAINMLDNPEKVHLFESQMAAFGNEMLILELVKMIEEDKGIDEITSRINTLNKNSGLLFTLGNLDSIIRSGRLSKTKAMIGKVLRVKPIIGMFDGKLDLYKSARTNKKVLEEIITEMKLKADGYNKMYVRVLSRNSLELATKLKEEVEVQFKNLEITFSEYLGPVFCLHLGEFGYGLSWTFE